MRSAAGDLGLIGESAFCTEALKRGIGISIVLGHCHPFDVITFCDKLTLKVQIKTTSHLNSNGGYLFGTNGNKYGDDDFDFYVLCILNLNAFYIVPRKMIKERSTTITIGKKKSSALSEFRDRWDLLKN